MQKMLLKKDFFKLMNNSVFGKTMENIRKRVDVRLVTNKKKLLKLTSKPTYVSSKIFNENLVAVHKIKETLTLNRPAYVRVSMGLTVRRKTAKNLAVRRKNERILAVSRKKN